MSKTIIDELNRGDKIPYKELSVIIVGYKNEKITLDCIESIYSNNDIGEKLEVILVDNSPEHNVYGVVSEKYSDVICVKNFNNGFGGGNNVGARLARGKYLLFLNPDTIVIEPIFKYALQQFHKYPKIGMFGVKLVSPNFKNNLSFYLINSGGLIWSVVTKIINFLDLYIDGYMYVAGADMFVRKDDFFNCGQFDEKIFMYYEEPDLTLRLHKIGKKTAYFKDRKIIHLEGGTSDDNELALRRRLDSALYFNNKIGRSAFKMFKRELRFFKLKKCIKTLAGSKSNSTILMNIRVLEEYLKLS